MLSILCLVQKKSAHFKLLCAENAESADGFLLLRQQSGYPPRNARKSENML
ncbi:MAG: hypothetical protein K2G60_03405 [Oscillospiraceae bacterium]|nr:hypothetical protein [Oscillospiraceae bacterium]